MINVIKYNEKNKADMDEYSTKVIFDLFPVIRSRIFEAGAVTDDYWDQVHYTTKFELQFSGAIEKMKKVASRKYNI